MFRLSKPCRTTSVERRKSIERRTTNMIPRTTSVKRGTVIPFQERGLFILGQGHTCA